jgi:hypothetical protein
MGEKRQYKKHRHRRKAVGGDEELYKPRISE